MPLSQRQEQKLKPYYNKARKGSNSRIRVCSEIYNKKG